MALPKAVRVGILLLVICLTLDRPGFRQSVSVFFEELRMASSSILLAREKRATPTNVTEHDYQLVITFPDLESLQMILSNISFPIPINNTVEIKSIETTTVCSSNITGYQCVCEENFAWSYNNCITYGVCDAIIGDTCGCIKNLPADGQYCQPNSTQIVTTTATPSSTQPKDPVDIDVKIVVLVPTSTAPTPLFSLFRSGLQYINFPITLSQSMTVKEISFTTACDPFSVNGLRCQCENGFAWPCDMCNSSNSCTNETCTCIYGLPSNDEFCQPITNITICEPTLPPTPDRVDIDVVLDLRIPFSTAPSDLLDLIRTALENETFPIELSQFIDVVEIELTTACSPNSTDELLCECERGFAWPCDLCNSNKSCNDPSNQFCTCVNGLPSSNSFCQPITNTSVCPTPTPVITTTPTTPSATYEIDLVLELNIPFSSYPSDQLDVFREGLKNKTFFIPFSKTLNITELILTTVCYPNSTYGLQCRCESGFAWPCEMCNRNTSCSSQICTCIYGLPANDEFCQPITSNATCPTPTPDITTTITTTSLSPTYEIDLVLEMHIPVTSLQGEIIDTFRKNLLNESFPTVHLQQSLTVLEIQLTTVCDPNTTYGLQCQCEDGFAWPCDMCNRYNSCSSQICTCIYGLPSNNEFCQPFTNRSICPTPTTDRVDIDVVLDLRIPFSTAPSDLLDLIRTALENETFPIELSQFIDVVEIELTTACSPNSTDELLCECERGFAWPCDLCNSNKSCNDPSNQFCTCVNGLPSSNSFCQPITNTSVCPTPTPVITTTPTTPSATYEIDLVLELNIPFSSYPSDQLDVFREGLKNKTFFITFSKTLNITKLILTTVCYPNSTYGLQCQCEDGFAWPCEMCNRNTSCSSQICTCIYGLPANDEFCQPITNSSICPTPTSVGTTTTAPATSTAAPTTTTAAPTMATFAQTTTTTASPPPTKVDIGVTLVFRIPSSSVGNNTLSFIRRKLDELTSSVTLPTSLKVKEINLTTVCAPNTTKELRCQCEDNFAWPCDLCNSSNSCNDVNSQHCTCRDRLPSINQYCQPLLKSVTCPVILTTTPPPTTTTTAMPAATTVVSTIKTVATPTSAATEPTVSPKRISDTITMDMAFSNSFNDKSNTVYQNIKSATEEECKRYVSATCTVNNLTFREGSTIAEYDLIVPSNTKDETIPLIKNGILTKVASQYPVSISSETPLEVSEDPFYVGDTLIVTCRPPDPVLGQKVTVLWTHNGNLIARLTSLSNNVSTYTINPFLEYDNGNYECKVSWGANSTFIQRRTLKSNPAPVVTVEPLKATLRCSDSTTLSCSANNGLAATLLSPDNQGLGSPYQYTAPSGCTQQEVKYTCVISRPRIIKKEITLVLTPKERFDCTDPIYGNAVVGVVAVAKCEEKKEGEKTAVCMSDGSYGDKQDNCVLKVIVDLLDRSEVLTELTIPVFLEDLKDVTVKNNKDIIESPATIVAMVKIFENVADKSTFLKININKNSTRNFLESAGLLTIDDSRQSWAFINDNNTRNPMENDLSKDSSSSSFLNVFESLTTFIGNDSFDINTDFILLNKTKLTDPFNSEFNSSVAIEIPEAGGQQEFITIIVFASMYNVLPGRDEYQINTSSSRVHGRVVLVRPEVEISNISLTFDVINYTNDTLGNPKCVFWDFNLHDGLGGWSDDGCSLVYHENETVSCNCNHTTSFSILMSPDSPRSLILDYITYIGVSISMACLVICLIIEAIIWRKVNKNATSYLRHVSIVNIAVSLLIANIWFIIGAAISDADKKNPPACTAATFFIHFFYLALFFWMFASALLLFYRTVSVFDGGLSKISMLIIGFSLGYGAPLIIATITIAATAPSNQYIRENVVCWLNWYESKALLAFVIPALMIVVINFIILIVVLYKILRRRVGGNAAQAGEKHVLYVIARSLAVLTPFFGLTWGLGIGTMVDPKNFGIHVAFAFFNSLQGFFILVFGTLLDKKVWSAMNIRSLTSQGRTQSTSAGTSSGGLSNLFQRMRRNRGSRSGYHVSSTGQSGTSGSESFNT